MFTFLSGYRTYIVGAVTVGFSVLQYLDIISPATLEVFLGLFTGAGLAALRAGLKNDTRNTVKVLVDAVKDVADGKGKN